MITWMFYAVICIAYLQHMVPLEMSKNTKPEIMNTAKQGTLFKNGRCYI